MNDSDKELMKNHIEKNFKIFFIVLCLIALIECCLTIWGLTSFNLTKLKNRLYLWSYIVLFISSLFSVLILALGKRKNNFALMTAQTYVYAFSLLCWSAFVSVIDLYASGDSMILVYVMTGIATGALILVKPWLFDMMLGLTSMCLLVFGNLLRDEPLSNGFYINFAFFLTLAVFVNNYSYRLNMRQYESTKKLKSLSYTDQLTGVYNRRRLDVEIINRIGQEDFLFLLTDIDNFKTINDAKGHAVGDQCLQQVSKAMQDAFGKWVFRFGGDEFAVISTGMTPEQAAVAIDRINSMLQRFDEDIDLHLSAGIYSAVKDNTAGDIFIRTDRALYDAKRGGKNTWCIYQSNTDIQPA